jgi:hypothetical protein
MEGSCEYAAADSRQGWSSSLGVGRGANNRKNYRFTKHITKPRTWTDSLLRLSNGNEHEIWNLEREEPE